MSTERQQVGSIPFGIAGSPHRFPVQRDGIIGCRMPRRLNPASQHVFARLHIQSWQQSPGQRPARRKIQACPEYLPQQGLMLATPLSDRFSAVTIADPCRYQAGQEEGYLVA